MRSLVYEIMMNNIEVRVILVFEQQPNKNCKVYIMFTLYLFLFHTVTRTLLYTGNH